MAKVFYQMNPDMAYQLGRLCIYDLPGGVSIEAGQQYDLEAMFGAEAVHNSKQLRDALNINWLQTVSPPASGEGAETSGGPQTATPPTTPDDPPPHPEGGGEKPSKDKSKEEPPKADPPKAPPAVKIEPQADPETATRIFDVALTNGVIRKTKNHFLIPNPANEKQPIRVASREEGIVKLTASLALCEFVKQAMA